MHSCSAQVAGPASPHKVPGLHVTVAYRSLHRNQQPPNAHLLLTLTFRCRRSAPLAPPLGSRFPALYPFATTLPHLILFFTSANPSLLFHTLPPLSFCTPRGASAPLLLRPNCGRGRNAAPPPLHDKPCIAHLPRVLRSLTSLSGAERVTVRGRATAADACRGRRPHVADSGAGRRRGGAAAGGLHQGVAPSCLCDHTTAPSNPGRRRGAFELALKKTGRLRRRVRRSQGSDARLSGRTRLDSSAALWQCARQAPHRRRRQQEGRSG